MARIPKLHLFAQPDYKPQPNMTDVSPEAAAADRARIAAERAAEPELTAKDVFRKARLKRKARRR